VSENEESSDEVDVVSVSQSSPTTSRPVSVVRELLVLPRACSVLARVTAMHNYSSASNGSGHHCSSSSSLSSSAAAGSGGGVNGSGSDGVVYSAPQSPSTLADRLSLRPRLDRRCLSTPASPSRHHSTDSTGAATTIARRRSSRRHRRSRHGLYEWTGSDESDSPAGHSTSQFSGGGGGGVKRAHHNVLERRRRDDLKSSFDALRAVVPGTGTDVRVPKVMILRRARDYVRQLMNTSQRLNSEYSRLCALHQSWTYKLSLLNKHDFLLNKPDDDDRLTDDSSSSTWLRRSEH